MEKMARSLICLGARRAMVVYGQDGLDEITLTGQTEIIEINNGWMRSFVFDPQDFGFSCCQSESLKGGDLKTNCEIVLSILEGQKGPQRDAVLLNAAAAIYLSEVASDFKEALDLAAEAIDSGKARQKLDELIMFSNQESL